jgi:hypothetical protein
MTAKDIKYENKIKTVKITSDNIDSITTLLDSNMIQEYAHYNQAFMSNDKIQKQGSDDINDKETKILKQKLSNDIIQLLGQCVPLLLYPMPMKELSEGTAYREIIQSLTNMHDLLITRFGNILVEYDLDLISKIKDLLERKNNLIITDPNDQYDLFLLHHGAGICCRDLFEIEETMTINPNTKGHKKALKQYKNVVNQIIQKNYKILLEILQSNTIKKKEKIISLI